MVRHRDESITFEQMHQCSLFSLWSVSNRPVSWNCCQIAPVDTSLVSNVNQTMPYPVQIYFGDCYYLSYIANSNSKFWFLKTWKISTQFKKKSNTNKRILQSISSKCIFSYMHWAHVLSIHEWQEKLKFFSAFKFHRSIVQSNVEVELGSKLCNKMPTAEWGKLNWVRLVSQRSARSPLDQPWSLVLSIAYL